MLELLYLRMVWKLCSIRKVGLWCLVGSSSEVCLLESLEGRGLLLMFCMFIFCYLFRGLWMVSFVRE